MPRSRTAINAAEGEVVVGADDGVRRRALGEQTPRHARAVGEGGVAEPDTALGERGAHVLKAAPDALEPVGRAQVVVAPADEGHAAAAAPVQVLRREHAGVYMIYVNPTDLAREAGDAEYDVREAFFREQRGELVGHDGDVRHDCVGAAAGDNFPGGLAGVGLVRAVQLERVAAAAQHLLRAGDNLEHMRVFEGDVAVEVGEQRHASRRAAGEALGAGVRE